MKAVNSEARPIAGLAKGVPIKIWFLGAVNLMAVPLDDFQVILGSSTQLRLSLCHILAPFVCLALKALAWSRWCERIK